jgi:hypothetical protein
MHRTACIDCGQVGGRQKSLGTPRQPSDFRVNCTVSRTLPVDKYRPGRSASLVELDTELSGRELGLFAYRTEFLPDEKTRRPTRLSGHFLDGPGELVTREWSPTARMPITRQAGAAGRNRTCDPLLRREMLYPLSYSRAVSQCIKGRRPSRAGRGVHGLPKPTKLHKFQACEDTLYRGTSSILSLVRRRHGDDAATSLEARRRQTWVRNSRLPGCWPWARSPVH